MHVQYTIKSRGTVLSTAQETQAHAYAGPSETLFPNACYCTLQCMATTGAVYSLQLTISAYCTVCLHAVLNGFPFILQQITY